MLIPAALGVMLLLGACRPKDAASTSGLKIINYANGNAPPVLEPVMNNYLKGSYIMVNLFDGLFRIGKNGIAEPGYAESHTVSPDGLVWTFTIRENARFSDGSPLTARDWERSVKHRLRPDIASKGVDLYMFIKNAEAFNQSAPNIGAADVGIKALDGRTLEITLENPTPFFTDVACYLFPYKMDILEQNPEWFKKPETFIGNGAFRVKAVDPQTGFVFEKNPNYFDADNVKIDLVNYQFIDNDAVAFSAYRNGDLNVHDGLDSAALQSYRDSPELHTFPVIGTGYTSVHTGNIPDARVRRALSLAIDRERLLKNILQLPYRPAEGAVPYGIHWGGREFREVAGNLIKFDLDEARRLLAEAGYPDGAGLPTYRIICQNSRDDQELVQAYQAMWKEIGVESTITTYEPSVYWDVLDTDNWDLARDGWTGDYDDPKTSLFIWMAYKEGPNKEHRWYNTPNAREFDRLMQAADRELDAEKRMTLFQQAEKVLLEDMPSLMVSHYVETALIKPEVTGIVKSNIGHIYFRYADIRPAR